MKDILCPKGSKGFSGWVNFYSDILHIQVYGTCICCTHHEAKEHVAKQLMRDWLGIPVGVEKSSSV